MSNPLLEAALSELSDEDLIHHMANLFERTKRLMEAKKIDEQLLGLKQTVKDYEDRHYDIEKKLLNGKLKVARDQAKARGLEFKEG